MAQHRTYHIFYIFLDLHAPQKIHRLQEIASWQLHHLFIVTFFTQDIECCGHCFSQKGKQKHFLSHAL